MPGSSMTDAASGLGSDVGSIFGYYLTGDNRQKAQEDYENALKAYQGLAPATVGANAYDSMDPAGTGAQKQALAQLQQIYSSGGLDPATRAQLNQVGNTNALQARAQEGRIQNEMQRRGMGGSGTSIDAQERAAQTASMGDYNAGVDAAALGANRKMQAIQDAAGIGAGLTQQAGDRAAAQNAIRQFNANQTNQMRYGQAQGEAGAYGNMAKDQTAQAKQEEDAAAGIGGTLGTLAGGAAQALTGGLF